MNSDGTGIDSIMLPYNLVGLDALFFFLLFVVLKKIAVVVEAASVLC
jgi:hypothetical protein